MTSKLAKGREKMRKYEIILFDLDGTIVNSEAGIIESIQHSLACFDIYEKNISYLRQIIGPPLEESFSRLFKFTPTQIEKAVAIFRNHYAQKGVHEFLVYEGIPELLQSLHQSGIKLAVATSKPTVFAEQILKTAGLRDYFSVLVGSGREKDLDKATIIEQTLQAFTPISNRSILMVGDRKYDILGARSYGLHTCAVTYGFGSLDELQLLHPDYIINAPLELLGLL
jgi:phosphoglycolate phosphatase